MALSIDRTEIESWGKIFDSKGNFPKLIGKLIFETTRRDTVLHFASGSEIFLGGWDGRVMCLEKTGHVPKGMSLWEIGTNGDLSKANSDYKKRVSDSLGFERKDSTYVFVTTVVWQDKTEWVSEKKKDGIWKDVFAYDSTDIAEWLENAPVSMRWFLSVTKDYPYDSIYSAEESWNMFSFGPKGLKLPPSLVTAGREKEITILSEFLTGGTGLRAVRAATRDEAVAFIIAMAMQFEQLQKEQFMSRTVVVDSEQHFHATRINKFDLNIIAKLENISRTYSAAENHHVLLPLGPDDEFNSQDVILLPRIDRDGQIASLIKMGLTHEDAERNSRECGRDITHLKTLLGFPPPPRNHISKDKVAHFLVALLIGRWNSNSPGDRAIIEELSGLPYDTFEDNLGEFLRMEYSPLIRIGDAWRLASPWDAWTTFSSHLSRIHFERLRIAFLNIHKELDPALSLDPDQRYMAPLYNKASIYSSWIKEGVIQSLILVGVIGQNQNLPYLDLPQLWVDMIVESLLKGAHGELWASLDHYLPLLAEASPNKTIDAINNSLLEDEKHILKMFEEEASLVTPRSRHTGLLWALESLAWDKKYFHRSVMLLAKLSELDPGGTLSNRPLNSLQEILMPWHYQTFATLDQRMETLKEIIRKHRDIGWRLAFNLLPSHDRIAGHTNKMRWRLLDESYEMDYPWKVIYSSHSKILMMLLENTSFSENDLSSLVSISNNFHPTDRDMLFKFLVDGIKEIPRKNDLIWQAARKIVSDNTEFPDAGWALSTVELDKYRDVLERFEPHDQTSKLVWLYTEHWPVPLTGVQDFWKLHYTKQQEIIDENRLTVLAEVYKKSGLENILSLIPQLKEFWDFGYALATVLQNTDEIQRMISLLRSDDKNRHQIALGFIRGKTTITGINWTKEAFEKSFDLGLSNEKRMMILLTLPQERDVWDYIETLENDLRKIYWQEMPPVFWQLNAGERIYGTNKLLDEGRFIAALNVSYHNMVDLPSTLLLDILNKIATVETGEKIGLESFKVEAILNELDKRGDLLEKDMFGLEWHYLSILSSETSNRKPILLHSQLSENPLFFVEVLKMTYRPDDDKKEASEFSDEERSNRAKSGFKLLRSWDKIPGVDRDGKIDVPSLRKWIDDARKFATELGRLKVADAEIGQVLAEYPEKQDQDIWPPVEIAAILDEINTSSLIRNFSVGTTNKRSSTVRAVFDGGKIERSQAAYFRDLAQKHLENYPVTASILSNIASRFLDRARIEDEEAERERLDY
ncbi:MAG TPA: hypothetical protein VL443_05515 [Cyclobacteriaceae bacterium]|jgi:hypothetical protein|nr:hypothetical protein [Cyclobacteriaceae bacterium]